MLLGGQFSVLFDSEALDRDLTSLAATGGADAQALRLRALERKILTGEKGVTPLRSVFGRDATPWPCPGWRYFAHGHHPRPGRRKSSLAGIPAQDTSIVNP